MSVNAAAMCCIRKEHSAFFTLSKDVRDVRHMSTLISKPHLARKKIDVTPSSRRSCSFPCVSACRTRLGVRARESWRVEALAHVLARCRDVLYSKGAFSFECPLGSGFRVSGFRLRVSRSAVRVLRFVFRVSGLGSGISGLPGSYGCGRRAAPIQRAFTS